MDKINRELLHFISASPSPYHAVEQIRLRLEGEGYTELPESEPWKLTLPGKYYVRRNGSSIIALNLPGGALPGFMIMAGHSDSPSFRIKETAPVQSAGMYTQLNVEKYGGMLCSTWLDRPLSAAGRVAVREKGRIVTKLVNIDRDLLLIPNVAIHMDRGANEGKSYNPNVDMLPVLGSAELQRGFDALAAEAAGVEEKDLLSRDLCLYPRTPGTVWGAEEEFVSSPRLDDLQCVFACLEGLLRAKRGESGAVLAVFDNEEVGSGTKQGADSTFLRDVLMRAASALGATEAQARAAISASFMVSADNAHAVHPNHPEKADPTNRPYLNGGIVIKYHGGQKYTTDAVSAAKMKSLCKQAGVPCQTYANRSDVLGGSTLGNISTAHVSVSSVDIGLPQLAMHSAVETAGVKDTKYAIEALKVFYGE